MPILPTLIIFIFSASQVVFALLLREKQHVTIKTLDVNLDGIERWLTARYGGKPLQHQIDALTQAATDQQQYTEYLDTRLTAILDEVCAVKQVVHGEEKKTRKDIQEVKTRLADEEKDDQRQKARTRATKAKP